MPYLPLFLDVRGARCLVSGGNGAAAAKARLLLRAGAEVRVIARTPGPEMLDLIRAGRVAHQTRLFRESDLDGIRLVFDADPDPARSKVLRRAAEGRNILYNAVDRPEACDFVVPAILDRSPVVVAVSTGGTAPALARTIRQRLERAVPPVWGRLARAAGLCREAVKAALPAGRARQRFWDKVFAGVRADALSDDASLDEMTERIHALLEKERGGGAPVEASRTGTVTLAGAGPGDPGLLTLATARAVENADVILHDALVGPEVLDLARREARVIPVGKRHGRPSMRQTMINRLMAACARRGLAVVRLKGGDPFVFGRGGEELDYLRAQGIPVRVLPGVTAALGCAAQARIPLTYRGIARSLRLVTASCRHSLETQAIDWARMAEEHETTLAVYMGGGRIRAVARALLNAGMDPRMPTAVIENGARTGTRRRFAVLSDLATRPGQDDIPAGQGDAPEGPVMLLIGRTVGLAPGWGADLAPGWGADKETTQATPFALTG